MAKQCKATYGKVILCSLLLAAHIVHILRNLPSLRRAEVNAQILNPTEP